MLLVEIEQHKSLTHVGGGKYKGVMSWLCPYNDASSALITLSSSAFTPFNVATSAAVPEVSIPYCKNAYGVFNPGGRPEVCLITAYYESDGLGSAIPSGRRKENHAKLSATLSVDWEKMVHDLNGDFIEGWGTGNVYYIPIKGQAIKARPKAVFNVETAESVNTFNANTLYTNMGKINGGSMTAPVSAEIGTCMLLGGRFWYEWYDDLVYVDFSFAWNPDGWNNDVVSAKQKLFMVQTTYVATTPTNTTFTHSEFHPAMKYVDSSGNAVSNMASAGTVGYICYTTGDFSSLGGYTWWY